MQPSSLLVRSLLRNTSLATVAFGLVLGASCASSQDGFGGDDGGPGDDNSSNPSDDAGCGFSCGDAQTLPSAFCGTSGTPCTDFPADPVLDTNTPSNAPSLFSGQGSGTPPCLVEPEDGSLFPRNWVRPRFLFTGTASTNLYEITVHTDAEANDLKVYTTNSSWKLPDNIWQSLVVNAIGETITVSVRGVNSSGGTPSASTSASFTIAPVTADGAMVYWTTASFDNNATNTTLQGFHVGDEGVTTALIASQVQQSIPRVEELFPDGGAAFPSPQAPVKAFCIGCHTSTPDGNFVGFNVQWPWGSAMASIQADGGLPVGAQPPWLSAGAIQNLSPDFGKDIYSPWYGPPAIDQLMLGVQTFSKGHFASGDHVLISQLGAGWNSASVTDLGGPSGVSSQLAWFDLEWNPAGGVPDSGITTGLPVATPCTNVAQPSNVTTQTCLSANASNGGWGIVQRQGDTRGAGGPNWSHDGSTIAYASTDVGTKDGRMDCWAAAQMGVACVSDVFTVPYGTRPNVGGAATPVQGAADPGFNEYYPAFSPDDTLIAFNRVAVNHSMYNTPEAEVYVVPAAGGTASRLAANVPVACSNKTSPGVQNTWPKWAPNEVDGKDGKKYYWLTFSSTRSPTAQGRAQLYVTAVVIDPANNNAVTTYPAIYIWNQDPTVNNLIPSWDNFTIAKGVTMVQ